jgi:hypothetical protein
MMLSKADEQQLSDVGDAIIDAFTSHPARTDDLRLVVLLTTDRGALQLHEGYASSNDRSKPDLDVAREVYTHLRVMLNANGVDLRTFAPPHVRGEG